MTNQKQAVSVTQLKSLLVSIIDNDRKVCIRYRLIGGMWRTQHMRVLTVNDNTLMAHDEQANKIFTVKLSDIMQFELDGSIYGFQPHFHYEVNGFEN